MHITVEQESDFQQSTHCGICEEPFIDVDKVHDHDHLTGEYRCAAHLSCNLQYQPTEIHTRDFPWITQF